MSARLPSACSPPRFRRSACALMLMMSAAVSVAQTDVVPPPVPQADVESHRIDALPSTDPGYWIVSTHESPQSFDRECPQFRPCVTRFDCECGCHPRCARFSTMCQSLQPGVPICIYVHGSFVSTDDVAYQAASTRRWLQSASCGSPVHVINFTWPSSRPILIATVSCDVNLLGRRAARNGWYLAELLRHLPPESPICLIGHSHGTRVVASALHLMGGGQVQGVSHPYSRPNGRRIRTVFAAAAIRHDWLNPGERYGRALCSTECLINLKNRHDAALCLYPLRHPFSGHALGKRGFSSRDRRDLRGWSHKVQDYDVTRCIGHHHMWPQYLRYSSLAWLIRNYVFFPELMSSPPAMSTVRQPSAVPAEPEDDESYSSFEPSTERSPGELSLPSI